MPSARRFGALEFQAAHQIRPSGTSNAPSEDDEGRVLDRPLAR
jgi:hypothetical protein